MKVKILNPQRVVFESLTARLVTMPLPAEVISVSPGHQSMVCALGGGSVIVDNEEGMALKKHVFVISEGAATVCNDAVTVFLEGGLTS